MAARDPSEQTFQVIQHHTVLVSGWNSSKRCPIKKIDFIYMLDYQSSLIFSGTPLTICHSVNILNQNRQIIMTRLTTYCWLTGWLPSWENKELYSYSWCQSNWQAVANLGESDREAWEVQAAEQSGRGREERHRTALHQNQGREGDLLWQVCHPCLSTSSWSQD